MIKGDMGYNGGEIRQVIRTYDALYPTGVDSIAWCMIEAKSEQEEMERSRRVSKSGVILESESGRRQKFTMPSNLYISLKKNHPELFKRDLKEFERDFPVFFKAWRTH